MSSAPVLPADVAPDSRHRRRHLSCISSQFTTVNPRSLFAFGIAFVSVRRGKKWSLKSLASGSRGDNGDAAAACCCCHCSPAVFVIVQLDFDEPPSHQPVISSVCHCVYAAPPQHRREPHNTPSPRIMFTMGFVPLLEHHAKTFLPLTL